MILQQISLFLENRAGQLAEITALLSAEGIDLRALNIAETADYGVLRLIASDPEKAVRILREHEMLVSLTPVVAAAVPDRPGGLCTLLTQLAMDNFDISYMYSVFGYQNGKALMIFRVNDPAALEAALQKQGFETGSTDFGVHH